MILRVGGIGTCLLNASCIGFEFYILQAGEADSRTPLTAVSEKGLKRGVRLTSYFLFMRVTTLYYTKV